MKYDSKNLKIEVIERVTKETIEPTVSELIRVGFGEWDPKWFYSSFDKKKNLILHLAVVDAKPVGFKLGHPREDKKFYSWLGCVIPDYRRKGVAEALMLAQHEWCKKSGYQTIQTKSQNRFRNMIILNLKNGFDIVGTHDSDEGGMKIVMEKKL